LFFLVFFENITGVGSWLFHKLGDTRSEEQQRACVAPQEVEIFTVVPSSPEKIQQVRKKAIGY